MRRAAAVLFLFATVAGAEPLRSAPVVELHLEDGRTVPLSAYAGKVVLVDFWASWCGPCKASFPALDALQREWRARGLDVIAVNVDESRHAADSFLARRPHELAVAFDPRGDIASAFKVDGMPSSFILDRAGSVRFSHAGYSAKVLAAYRSEIETLL